MTRNDQAHARLDQALEDAWTAADEAGEDGLAAALSDLELLYGLALHREAHGCFASLAEEVREAARQVGEEEGLEVPE